MRGKLRELMAWELQDNWSFPILEIVVAITIVQVMSFTHIHRSHASLFGYLVKPFFENISFVIIISAAIVFGKSFASSIEERKLVLLLSYSPTRVQVFVAKYLTNFFMLFLIFGTALLVQGTSLFLFGEVIPMAMWAFMFLYLLFAVFFTSSLMTFIALGVKRFGLSVLVFLVFMFGMEYGIPINARDPISYLMLKMGPVGAVGSSITWFSNLLGIRSSGLFSVSLECFLAATGYLLIGGIAFLLTSLFAMKRIDLD